MPTLFVSEGKIIRKEVKNFLHNLSKKKKLRILDIGASANPWLGELFLLEKNVVQEEFFLKLQSCQFD